MLVSNNPQAFILGYVVSGEAKLEVGFCRSKFADLPAFGLWADRAESDDELLAELLWSLDKDSQVCLD